MVLIDICVYRWDGLDVQYVKWVVDVFYIVYNFYRLVKDIVVYNLVILVDIEIKFF